MRISIKQQLNTNELNVVADFSDAISALNYIKENEEIKKYAVAIGKNAFKRECMEMHQINDLHIL